MVAAAALVVPLACGGGLGGTGGSGGNGGAGGSPCWPYGAPLTSTVTGAGFDEWEGEPAFIRWGPFRRTLHECERAASG